MSAFEDFVILELPRRPPQLGFDVTGEDGDPNDSVNPVVNNAPQGSFFLDTSTNLLWVKTVGGPSGSLSWERIGSGDGVEVTGGAPVAFNVNGSLALLTAPTGFLDGLRAIDAPGEVFSVTMTLGDSGTSGTTEVRLYKVTPGGSETLITTASTLTIAGGSGTNVSYKSRDFVVNEEDYAQGARLGIKLQQIAAGASDLCVTVRVHSTVSHEKNLVFPMNALTTQLTPQLVGSVYLESGTILGALSFAFLGNSAGMTETATLDIRRHSDAALIKTVSASDTPASVSLSPNFNVPTTDWYDLYLSTTSGAAVASLFGLKLAYGAALTQRVRSPLFASQTGSTFLQVGSIYLLQGTLSVGSRVMIGATGGSLGSELELRRFTGGAVVATFTNTGSLDSVELVVDAALPADDWYDLYLRGDVGGSTATLAGIDFTAVGD